MMAISVGVAFVLTWMFGYKDPVSGTCQEAEKEKTQGEKAEAEKLEIQESVTGEILLDSHMEGEAIPMSEVKDETFAAEVLEHVQIPQIKQRITKLIAQKLGVNIDFDL